MHFNAAIKKNYVEDSKTSELGVRIYYKYTPKQGKQLTE
jgi:hypothetical protein